MEQNVGNTDQLARIVIGAVAGIISLAILAGLVAAPPALAAVLGVGAAMLLGTAVTGTCGMYTVLGVSTCPRDS